MEDDARVPGAGIGAGGAAQARGTFFASGAAFRPRARVAHCGKFHAPIVARLYDAGGPRHMEIVIDERVIDQTHSDFGPAVMGAFPKISGLESGFAAFPHFRVFTFE